MDDKRYYNYMKSYVLGSLDAQKRAGYIDEERTEKEHLITEGIASFLELVGIGYSEDHEDEEINDNEWNEQTRSYIEDTIGRELTEREIGAYYGLNYNPQRSC
jgi:hypothetical protein